MKSLVLIILYTNTQMLIAIVKLGCLTRLSSSGRYI